MHRKAAAVLFLVPYVSRKGWYSGIALSRSKTRVLPMHVSTGSSASLGSAQFYVPSNFVAVVARCGTRCTSVVTGWGGIARTSTADLPTVRWWIQSTDVKSPIIGHGERAESAHPFRHKLYWLCHSAFHKAVADLGRRGYVNRIANERFFVRPTCVKIGTHLTDSALPADGIR